MPYTAELKGLIKKVEATRPARIERKKRGEEFRPLTLKEREERLRKYHPDFVEGARKEIRVGPSKGYAISPEIVALLEELGLPPHDIEQEVGIGQPNDLVALLNHRSGQNKDLFYLSTLHSG